MPNGGGSTQTETPAVPTGVLVNFIRYQGTYRVNLNLIVKVLDFVQFGGPEGTVRSTVFELVAAL